MCTHTCEVASFQNLELTVARHLLGQQPSLAKQLTICLHVRVPLLSEVKESRTNLPLAWAGRLGKPAVAALAAALLLTSPGDALAATGGRVGGSAYRSDRSQPSRTYNNNSRSGSG